MLTTELQLTAKGWNRTQDSRICIENLLEFGKENDAKSHFNFRDQKIDSEIGKQINKRLFGKAYR